MNPLQKEILQAKQELFEAEKKRDYNKVKLNALEMKNSLQKETVLTMINLFQDKYMDAKGANELRDYVVKAESWQ